MQLLYASAPALWSSQATFAVESPTKPCPVINKVTWNPTPGHESNRSMTCIPVLQVDERERAYHVSAGLKLSTANPVVSVCISVCVFRISYDHDGVSPFKVSLRPPISEAIV
ncbi:hypothetical protein BDV19DRAFT_348015 [Aspergillus venezuelensis]